MGGGGSVKVCKVCVIVTACLCENHDFTDHKRERWVNLLLSHRHTVRILYMLQ